MDGWGHEGVLSRSFGHSGFVGGLFFPFVPEKPPPLALPLLEGEGTV